VRPGESVGEVIGGESGGARRRRIGRGGRGGGTYHVLDWTNGGDRVFGEWECHGDGADEFAVDVDGAAAHSFHDAGVFEGPAGEAREDEGFLGAEVVEDAENFDLELVDAVTGEDGAAGASHAGSDIFHGEERGLRGQSGGESEDRGGQKAGHVLL